MWEELLKMFSSGAAEGMANGAMSDIAGQLAMKADPGGMASMLGQLQQAGPAAAAPMAANPPGFSSLVNPTQAANPMAGTTPSMGEVGIPGTAPAQFPGGNIMLTPQPGAQAAPPVPQVPNAPSWGNIVPPAQVPTAATAAAASPPVTNRPSVGLTPEQAMALMKGSQGQEQQTPRAPAVNGQPSRTVQFSQLAVPNAPARPMSLADLLYRRR